MRSRSTLVDGARSARTSNHDQWTEDTVADINDTTIEQRITMTTADEDTAATEAIAGIADTAENEDQIAIEATAGSEATVEIATEDIAEDEDLVARGIAVVEETQFVH